MNNKGTDRSESRHLDAASHQFIAKLCARMDGLLRSGLPTETVRPNGPVDSSAYPDVLLETMAQTETASRNTDPTWGGDSSCSHSQEPVAHGTVFNRNLAIVSGVGLTNAWLDEQGLLSLKTLWGSLAHLR